VNNELTERLHLAYEKFKHQSDEQTHDKFLSQLEKVHDDAQKVVDGVSETFEGSEFAHAIAGLNKLRADKKALPATEKEMIPRVTSSGELLGTGKWELLDVGWLQTLEQILCHFDDRVPFNTQPVTLQIPDDVTFAVAGDWGTGPWKDRAPSTLVKAQIEKVKADYTIHLGDVYYAGTEQQEIDNLVECWPMGQKGGFTLNSNHEMYSGGYGYFEHALKHKFTQQQGCSYFALENSDWLILGLDTAYHASIEDLYLKGNLGKDQIQWLSSLPKGKRIMVLSHHQGFELVGKENGPIYDQVVDALGTEPDYWYWGHLHNAVVYQEKGKLNGRCIGHGAIPYGDARACIDEPAVTWYESKLAGDPQLPKRVLNGFAYITLSGGELNEMLIGEDGDIRWHPPH